MDKWEYLAVTIIWDDKQKNWVTTATDKSIVVGFTTILNRYGEQGWELANLVVRDWNSASFQGAHSSVDVYIEVFKRRK